MPPYKEPTKAIYCPVSQTVVLLEVCEMFAVSECM